MAQITHPVAQGPAQQEGAAAPVPAPAANVPVGPVEAQAQLNVLDHHHGHDDAPGQLLNDIEVENAPDTVAVEFVHIPDQGVSPLYHSLYGFPLGN